MTKTTKPLFFQKEIQDIERAVRLLKYEIETADFETLEELHSTQKELDTKEIELAFYLKKEEKAVLTFRNSEQYLSDMAELKATREHNVKVHSELESKLDGIINKAIDDVQALLVESGTAGNSYQLPTYHQCLGYEAWQRNQADGFMITMALRQRVSTVFKHFNKF